VWAKTEGLKHTEANKDDHCHYWIHAQENHNSLSESVSTKNKNNPEQKIDPSDLFRRGFERFLNEVWPKIVAMLSIKGVGPSWESTFHLQSTPVPSAHPARFELLRRQNGSLSTPTVTETPPPTTTPGGGDGGGGGAQSAASSTTTIVDPPPPPPPTSTTQVSSDPPPVSSGGGGGGGVPPPSSTTTPSTTPTSTPSSNPGGVVSPTTTPTSVTTSSAGGGNGVGGDGNGGLVISTTDAQGSIYLTTVTPIGGVTTQVVIRTTTLPGGNVVTLTSTYTLPRTFSPSTPTAGATSVPQLQGGAAPELMGSSRRMVKLGGVIITAVLFGGMLL
jgi:hypothetical protein